MGISRHVSVGRGDGFTLVELLLAIVLSSVVAVILGASIHALVMANGVQGGRARGPAAVHAALRRVWGEVSAAYRPPVLPKDGLAFRLAVSLDPGEPETELSFFGTVPWDDAPPPYGYDVAEITYTMQPIRAGVRELRRIAHPCSGPDVEKPTTNVLLRGDFHFQAQVLDGGEVFDVWPPTEGGAVTRTNLPGAVRLTIRGGGGGPITCDVLIQAAHGIRAIPLSAGAGGGGGAGGEAG